MVSTLTLFYFMIVVIDIINLIDLRKLTYSFLLSKRNLKAAKKIHSAQTRTNKITLSYIRNYTAYPKEFNVFQKLWIVYILIIVPQYVSIVIVNFFSILLAKILLIIVGIVKFVFAIVIAAQFSSKRISRFDKRY